MGSIASHGSGDLFIAFATGNRGLGVMGTQKDPRRTIEARMVVDKAISPLFQAAIEATEAAVVNALLAAETLTGRDGITAHALDHGTLNEVPGLESPTLENLCLHFAGLLKPAFPALVKVTVSRPTVSESCTLAI